MKPCKECIDSDDCDGFAHCSCQCHDKEREEFIRRYAGQTPRVPADERCGPLRHGGPCLLRKGHRGEHNAWADLHSANTIAWLGETLTTMEKELRDARARMATDAELLKAADAFGLAVRQALVGSLTGSADAAAWEIQRLKRENERLEALFQQTHGVHWSWVAKAQEVDAWKARAVSAEAVRDELHAKIRSLESKS